MSRIHLGLLDELLNISILNEESSARSSELKFRVALELSASGSESVKQNLVLDLDKISLPRSVRTLPAAHTLVDAWSPAEGADRSVFQ